MIRKTFAKVALVLAQMAADGLFLTCAFFALYIYRITRELGLSFKLSGLWRFDQLRGLTNFDPYFKMYVFVLALSLVFLAHFRAYWLLKRESPLDKFTKVFKALTFAVLIAIGSTFAFKIPYFSRFIFFSYWFAGVLMLWLWRMLLLGSVIKLTHKGFFTRRILVVGAGQMGRKVVSELRDKPGLGVELLGFTDDDPGKAQLEVEGVRVVGTNQDLEELITTCNVEEIIITIPSERSLISQIITRTRRFGVEIRVIPEMYDLVLGGVQVGQLGPIPYMMMLKTPMRGWPLVIKRVIDIAVSAVCLVCLAPLFVLIALLIYVDNPGPVIFRQQRLGKNGRIFDFYKLRSMVVDAEALKAGLVDDNEADGPVFKIREDPRITRVGRFIRKYSIDELPQLYNVLKGDMSLVGPRPPLPKEVELYTPWEWRRLEVTPGLTCIWQVSGRSNITFEKWMELDVYYIENWSLWLDLKILLQTIPVVLIGKGAY